jgi:hypothetical protein
LDYYLGRTGYSSRQTSERIEPERQDNLFEPVQGNYSAHGRFDERAAGRSMELWLDTHPATLTGVALLAISLGFAGVWRMLHR